MWVFQPFLKNFWELTRVAGIQLWLIKRFKLHNRQTSKILLVHRERKTDRERSAFSYRTLNFDLPRVILNDLLA